MASDDTRVTGRSEGDPTTDRSVQPRAAEVVAAGGVLVRTHPGLCRGWGNCHRFAPTVYPVDAEGTVDVHRLAVPAEYAADAILGAAACPEQAITIVGREVRVHGVEARTTG